MTLPVRLLLVWSFKKEKKKHDFIITQLRIEKRDCAPTF